ncbi:MAG: dihydrodipicolinate synthase family protein [Pirellulales bacterium]|nr:dihydrodipicolinate synthase family protein [Pirellulales bacterium]
MTTLLHGVFTPNMVPLDDGGSIHEAELRRYLAWLIERGVHGLYPNGSTGEFLRFTAEERKRITQIVCDECRGKVPVLAGAAEANVRETLRACETYAGFGARAVAIVSPFYYKLGPEAVYAYFHEIATNAPIDVTLYNIPMFASPIDVPTIQRLAELPRVIGIKDSSGDISLMLRMMAAVKPVRPGFAFFTGWEAALLPMLLIGCDGATLATSGVVPEVTRALFDSVAEGRLELARDFQEQLTPLFDTLLTGDDFPEGFRAAIEARGFRMGPSRQPRGNRPTLSAATLSTKIARVTALLENPPGPRPLPD